MPYDQQPVAKQRSTVPARIIFALVLAAATVVFFGFAIPMLPSTTMTQEVTAAVNTPALWVTRFVFPDGQHSGPGALYWSWVYWPAGVVIYSIFWFIILSMLWSTRRTVYSRR